MARYPDTAVPQVAKNWNDYLRFLTTRRAAFNFRQPDTTMVWRWEQRLVKHFGNDWEEKAKDKVVLCGSCESSTFVLV